MSVTPAAIRKPNLSSGFTLIEVLVTLVVITLGLLGLAALQGHALKAESEAYYRSQAILLLEDMQDRLNLNRRVPGCFLATYGKGVTTSGLTCESGSSDAWSGATMAMRGWNDLLLGTTEKIGTTSVGTLPNAMGCVVQDGTDTSLYYIAIAWQGISETVAPNLPTSLPDGIKDCGKGQYGDDSARRLIWVQVRIANLF